MTLQDIQFTSFFLFLFLFLFLFCCSDDALGDVTVSGYQCNSVLANSFTLILVGYKAALTAVGAVIAFRVRSLGKCILPPSSSLLLHIVTPFIAQALTIPESQIVFIHSLMFCYTSLIFFSNFRQHSGGVHDDAVLDI